MKSVCDMDGAAGGSLGHTYGYTYDDENGTMNSMTVTASGVSDTMSSTLRIDGIDKLTQTIFELKPSNIPSDRKGIKQILNYNNQLGKGYKMAIVLY